MFVISTLCLLTISSSAVLVFGLPRITVISIPFTFYMYFRMRGKIYRPFLLFSVVYFFAFVPGVIANFGQGDVKLLSVLQLLSALFTFSVLGTFFYAWLTQRPDLQKKRDLEIVLLFFLAFSIVEVIFYESFAEARGIFYRTQFTDVYSQIFVNRELSLYGGRPTGFFSETSNFAKFMGLIVAAYMVVTRCSWRSLIALVVYMFVLKSISYFFAAPAMILALVAAVSGSTSASARGAGRVNFLTVAVVGIAVLIGVLVTQSDRVSKLTQVGDGSLNARIVFPAKYLATSGNLVFGKGLTPQDAVQDFTLNMKEISDRTRSSTRFTQGISTTVVIITGWGIIGLAVFIFGMAVLQGWTGLVLAVSFLLSNVISSGFNSVASFVPSGLLLGLVLYQLHLRSSVARADRGAVSRLLKKSPDVRKLSASPPWKGI